jgi:hypothetical protein
MLYIILRAKLTLKYHQGDLASQGLLPVIKVAVSSWLTYSIIVYWSIFRARGWYISAARKNSHKIQEIAEKLSEKEDTLKKQGYQWNQ